jgi:hypothetical protein
MAIINTPYDPNTGISISGGGIGRPANFGIYGTGAGGTIASNGNGNISSAVNVTQNAIEGQMFKAFYTVSEFEKLQFTGDENQWKEHVKMVLTQKLADELMKEKYIEFTRMDEDPVTGGTQYTARMFAVPDGQVRILRSSGFMKNS